MNIPQDRYVKVGTINTRYWSEGSQGSPVILIHGLGGYIEAWLPNFDALAAQHQVYAVDLLGHGRTEKPLDVSYTIASLTQFVKDFMAVVGVEQAHVVAHSLGGAIGTRLALTFPTVVDKLVLVDSAGLGKESSFVIRIASVPFLGEMLTRPSREGSASFLKMLVYDPAIMTDELVELNYEMAALPGAQQSFLKILRANNNLLGQKKSMYGPNVCGLPSITHAVLVIWGRQDKVLPVMHADVAAKGLPNVRVSLLDNCGHVPMLEHTQAFNELLLEFLRN
jgi:4,5:9,10-diseco-3-hydroxy-5,9,17-trioxoandrosta-1(10),2-diene-4-oate hydrolase